MGREVVALYTLDSRYAEAFLNYSLHNEKEKIIVKTFTNDESLQYAVGNDGIDLLLVDGMFMDETINALACNKAVLSREKYISRQDNPAIFMYQKAEVVFRQIYELLAEKTVEEKFCCAATSAMPDFIGVFSPCYQVEREQFARAAAKCMGESGRTLYINMSEFSEEDDGEGRGISELLLFIQQEDKSMKYKLSAMVESGDGYDSLGGVRHYQDLRDISEDDVARLIRQFETIDEYKKVVVDIGMLSPAAFFILGCCREVYMPVNRNFSYGRHEHLKHDIRVGGMEKLFGGFKELQVPEGWYMRKDIREKWVKQQLVMQK